MKFRTEVEIPQSETKINIEDQIFSIGSCFSTEISELLRKGQIQTLNNPFGTIFNPFSLNVALKKLHDSTIYEESDLVFYNEEFISLDHHSIYNSRFSHQTLAKINADLQSGNQFLQNTNWIIITYGTSFIYEFLPKKKLIANCHKIPSKYFEKKLLTHQEITNSIFETIENLIDICKEKVQILFTVSPVRHTKDGLVENNWSKSKLISAVHEVIMKFDNCHYLPIYELLMDDLRDYRFYKEDLIHPNNQAIQYIWEKFGNAYFSEETQQFITENLKISKALEHRTEDDKNPRYLEFVANLEARISAQQTKVKHKIF